MRKQIIVFRITTNRVGLVCERFDLLRFGQKLVHQVIDQATRNALGEFFLVAVGTSSTTRLAGTRTVNRPASAASNSLHRRTFSVRAQEVAHVDIDIEQYPDHLAIDRSL